MEKQENEIQFASIPDHPGIVECRCGQPLDRIDDTEEITCPECGDTGKQECYK